jgi:hypothetical protein
MGTKRTRLKRGRPCLPLRDDEDGYAIVYFAALRRVLKKRNNTSTRFVALTLMQLRYMRVDEDPENIQAMRDGRQFKIRARVVEDDEDEENIRDGRPFLKHCGNAKGSAAEHPRNESIFHAAADNFACKERELKKLDGKTDNGRWFIAMAKAWMLCLDGNGARSVAMARRLSASVGEEAYFKRVMFPIFMRRCNFLPAPDELGKIE